MLYVFLLVALCVVVSWPIGKMATWAMSDPVSDRGFRRAVENLFVKCGGNVVRGQQNWKQYALSMLLFNALIFDVHLPGVGHAAVVAAQSRRQWALWRAA